MKKHLKTHVFWCFRALVVCLVGLVLLEITYHTQTANYSPVRSLSFWVKSQKRDLTSTKETIRPTIFADKDHDHGKRLIFYCVSFVTRYPSRENVRVD